ncbi:MAG: hypothetical protein ACYTGH_18465 [Planctomycetota bacterium]|jgi:hypothetical protein
MGIDIRKALEEIRLVVCRSGQKQSLLKEIDDALASGDEDRMKAAIHRFDNQDTLVIERIRDEAEGKSTE